MTAFADKTAIITGAASGIGRALGTELALRGEGADLGVKVSVVCPGYIKTPIFHTSKLINLDREKVLKSLPEKFGITPEACALEILRGVERNKAIIAVTGLAKIAWRLYRVCPGFILWIMGREIKKGRAEMRSDH